MSRTCPYCNCSDIEENPERGDSTCLNCGTVLEESRIVSDVQFQETRGGGHEIIGQFVSAERSAGRLGGVPGLPKSESREVTYSKGKKLIQEIANQLQINNHRVNTAFNWYKMCVNRNFTRGRVRSHVVTACLYITCRLEETPHLLLDFSDVTQVNVFDLGRTLNFLTRSLKVNLPTTDPCLYILRFAIMLDLKEKQKDIVTLATRIVERMKRDWMSTGRRPTGICGAALLLACRAFNVNRAINDIVRVVHISETVVRKRLDEFGNTPSGSLTIDQFNELDLEESEDPPAFQAARLRHRDDKRREEMKAEAATRDMGNLHKQVEDALKQKMKKSPYAKKMLGTVKDADVPELSAAAGELQSELLDTVYQVAEENGVVTNVHSVNDYGPSLRSLGIISDAVPSTSTHQEPQVEVDDSNLEDIDDDEISSYILTEEEAEMKTEIWMAKNGIHLEELEKRKRARQEEEERERENPKKKRRSVVKKQPINAANYGDAVIQVIQETKLTNKIDYEKIKEINLLVPQNAHIHELPSVSTPISLSQQSYINGIANGVVTNGMNGVPATTPPSSQSQQGPSQIQASPSMAEEPKPTEREPEVEAKHLNQMTETDSNGNKEVIPKKEASPIKPAVKLQSRYKRNMVKPKAIPRPS